MSWVAPLLAGWRAALLWAQAAPIGAVTMLLIARLVGADWEAAFRPLLGLVPWLILAAVPVIVQQALIVPPPHLALWMGWPLFGLRSLIALGFWWWAARALSAGAMSRTSAGLCLLAHAILVSVIGLDWIMGVAPGQPETAIGMILAVIQIAAACAMACARGWGTTQPRRDLARLMLAAALGLAYLLFVDFLVVWYGNLPPRIGWYQVRMPLPWGLLPPLALAIGVFLTVALIVLDRTRAAGWSVLVALTLILGWLVAPIGGPIALAFALILIALAAIVPTRMGR